MKRLEITLKSGAQITVDATDVTLTRNRITAELTEVAWENGDGAKRRLMHVRVEEIAAVVTIR